MATHRILSIAGLLLLAGCVSSSAVRLGTESFEPRPEGHRIVVYDDVTEIGLQPFVKVGRILGEGSEHASFAAIVESMKLDARQLGADAIVLQGGGLLLSGGGEDCVSVDLTVNAVAIRWR